MTALFRNDAGTLTAMPISLPGYDEDSGYDNTFDLRSLTWADFDNDGDIDLLIPSIHDEATFTFHTALMRNDGDDGAGGWTRTARLRCPSSTPMRCSRTGSSSRASKSDA